MTRIVNRVRVHLLHSDRYNIPARIAVVGCVRTKLGRQRSCWWWWWGGREAKKIPQESQRQLLRRLVSDRCVVARRRRFACLAAAAVSVVSNRHSQWRQRNPLNEN